ncbi:zinc finger protein-domain-containing protein [Penicillium capsulatum]|uniref:Zinc finger protein-domain-containing protein n=1 Tax=Penicillium capsulatum TaxID=69766 RepID=A0A9W9ICA0_9EURO|nr:zinc finger protein-domain-containing protein [Penicillium capsulatum]KAJ6134991.1 zinc finger protein-domain-containing protein [Penicillium capsulatum]
MVEENLPLFADTHELTPLPAITLVTERIFPLPKVARQALITKYCPLALRAHVSANPTNRDCLARIYLGHRRLSDAPPPPNFTSRAIIHRAANVDGYDIEFVLGGDADSAYSQDISLLLGLTPEQLAAMPPRTDLEAMMRTGFKRRIIRVCVLDFNLCSAWEERVGWEDPEALIAHLVKAFFENGSYYPRPLMEHGIEKGLWKAFCVAYVRKGKDILQAPGKDQRVAKLAQMFIDACVLRERESLNKGFDHGHRAHKD